jgi:hypothetical protein
MPPKRNKQAQDSFMACQCLLSSLSINFLRIITAESTHYHLPAIVAANGPIPSGPLLLKIIIFKAHVDSRATMTFIHTLLTELDDKMIDLNSDIKAFNFFVQAQVKSLAARGETSSDLLVNLFKGYKVADDSEFQDFIRRKENEYKEGHDAGVNNLMTDSVAKYRARILSKKWSAPTKEQGQILALTTQVEQLKTKSKSKIKQPSAASATTTSTKKAPKHNQSPEWAWKNVTPKDGELTTKDFKGKHYHLACKFHPDRWVCHTTEDCSKNPDNTATASASTPTAEKGEKRRQDRANSRLPS